MIKPDDLNQSYYLSHDYRPPPDIAPSFNVCFVLVIEALRRSSMYLSAANNHVTKYCKEIDS